MKKLIVLIAVFGIFGAPQYVYIHYKNSTMYVTKIPPKGYNDFSDMSKTGPYYYKFKK